MGPDRNKTKKELRSAKKSSWHASSVLLLFSCTPARQLSHSQFSTISCNWNGLVETQGLSVPNGYGSIKNPPIETLPNTTP